MSRREMSRDLVLSLGSAGFFRFESTFALFGI